MDGEKFDAIVVGAGLAGSVAAYKLANEGLSVLLVERGNFAGAKNVSGGRLYTHTLEKIMPDFRDKAPLERKITKEKISILNGEQGTTVEYAYNPQGLGESYSVLRAKFDRWLADEAENAGAMLVSGIQASALLIEDGKVVGIKSGEDDFCSDVVVIADGVNSLLAEKAGLRPAIKPEHMAVGAKDVYKLDKEVLESRFGVDEKGGVSWLFLGDMTYGLMGGGFLYTNEDTISMGMVVGLHHIGDIDFNIEDMMNQFASHPTVAPLLKDAKLIERSGHVVPEAGLQGMNRLSGDGFVICGDAAGLCMNLGYTVRGMDLAIESGICAAEAIIESHKKGDFSKQALSAYDQLFMNTGCGKDLKLYRNMPEFMETKRIFQQYPAFVCNVMHDVFAISPQGADPLMKKMYKHVKEVGIVNLMKDALKGVRSL